MLGETVSRPGDKGDITLGLVVLSTREDAKIVLATNESHCSAPLEKSVPL